jgi:hypothetical protein
MGISDDCCFEFRNHQSLVWINAQLQALPGDAGTGRGRWRRGAGGGRVGQWERVCGWDSGESAVQLMECQWK